MKNLVFTLFLVTSICLIMFLTFKTGYNMGYEASDMDWEMYLPQYEAELDYLLPEYGMNIDNTGIDIISYSERDDIPDRYYRLSYEQIGSLNDTLLKDNL